MLFFLLCLLYGFYCIISQVCCIVKTFLPFYFLGLFVTAGAEGAKSGWIQPRKSPEGTGAGGTSPEQVPEVIGQTRRSRNRNGESIPSARPTGTSRESITAQPEKPKPEPQNKHGTERPHIIQNAAGAAEALHMVSDARYRAERRRTPTAARKQPQNASRSSRRESITAPHGNPEPETQSSRNNNRKK
jgi:hypothetical protein